MLNPHDHPDGGKATDDQKYCDMTATARLLAAQHAAAAMTDAAMTGGAESDAAIIERSLRQPEHFAAVFDRYYPEIHGYAARRLGQDLADDTASETFLVAFARRSRYDGTHVDARPWLYGIASNLIARHHRAEQRRYRALARTGVDDITDGHADRAVVRLDAQARRGHLAAALSQISHADRDVLLLVAWAELTSEQAGQALGIPAGTARSRLHRARKQIRAALDRTDPSTTTMREDHRS